MASKTVMTTAVSRTAEASSLASRGCVGKKRLAGSGRMKDRMNAYMDDLLIRNGVATGRVCRRKGAAGKEDASSGERVEKRAAKKEGIEEQVLQRRTNFGRKTRMFRFLFRMFPKKRQEEGRRKARGSSREKWPWEAGGGRNVSRGVRAEREKRAEMRRGCLP